MSHADFSSSARDDRGVRRATAGFTMLEILLSLGLIALLVAVLVGASSAMMSEKRTSPRDIFWQAVQEARKTALKSEQDVRLRFDAKEKCFVVESGRSKSVYPVPMTSDLTIDLLSTQKGNAGVILVGGVAVETATIPHATFFADGTCIPFRVQFHVLTGASVLSVDPWTCAPLLNPPDKPL